MCVRVPVSLDLDVHLQHEGRFLQVKAFEPLTGHIQVLLPSGCDIIAQQMNTLLRFIILCPTCYVVFCEQNFGNPQL